uniref:Uncharacterized protein n=1 Tax=Geladintestivirus 5 TaxID=3233137 RepID=A0AAU8MGZ3_9CAUD
MKEINPNILYLCIPKNWNNTYYKLLYLLADEGKNIIDDCNYTCSNQGNNVFTCWNLFQSAIAANEIGEIKKATLFINYINKQLDYYIKGKDIIVPKVNEDEEYPKISIEPNGDDIFTIALEYKDYQTTIKFPIIEIPIVYYGSNNTNVANDVDLKVFTKITDNNFNKTITIETTNINKYIWFVSTIELEFTCGGIPVTLNQTNLNDLYYYNTDALVVGKDNTFIINKK